MNYEPEKLLHICKSREQDFDMMITLNGHQTVERARERKNTFHWVKIPLSGRSKSSISEPLKACLKVLEKHSNSI